MTTKRIEPIDIEISDEQRNRHGEVMDKLRKHIAAHDLPANPPPRCPIPPGAGLDNGQ